jgi:hypothetical protein
MYWNTGNNTETETKTHERIICMEKLNKDKRKGSKHWNTASTLSAARLVTNARQCYKPNGS